MTAPDKARNLNWCFTWNNYTPTDIEAIKIWFPQQVDIRAIMFEEEVAPTTGTPHLQGFIVFKSKKTFKQVKEFFAVNVHLEMMKGSIEQNKLYCSKDNTGVTVLGVLPMSAKQKGQKGGLHGHKGAIHGAKAPDPWALLQADITAGMSKKDAAIKYPDLFGRCNKGFGETFELFKPKPMYDIRTRFAKLFEWQIELFELLEQEPNSRDVLWIWSNEGAVGKSETLKHLVSCNGFQPMQNAQSRDLSCAWKGGNVAFDYSRHQEGEINYSIIENIKNKLVFSPKYESTCKMSDNFKDVYVVCFSNSLPDITKLSHDRWKIYKINPDDNKSWQQCRILPGGIINWDNDTSGFGDISASKDGNIEDRARDAADAFQAST